MHCGVGRAAGHSFLLVHLSYITNSYTHRMEHAHMVHRLSLGHTGTYIHTPIYWSFCQKGRMICQHIILLSLPYSPPYLWNVFEDDKLLIFDLPTASHLLSHSFLWSGHPSRAVVASHVEMCNVCWAKALTLGTVAGSPTCNQAVRLDPARAPFTTALLSIWEVKKKATNDCLMHDISTSFLHYVLHTNLYE